MDNSIQLLLVCALPMGAALLCYLLAWLAPDSARRFNGPLGALALAGSAICAASLWAPLAAAQTTAQFVRPWIVLPDTSVFLTSAGKQLALEIPFSLQLMLPSLLFALSTALIGLAVLLYALRERRDDPRRGFFFAHLTLFSAAMLLLLCSDTLLLIYLAWELMGLQSYLLIAYRGTSLARRAGRLAFWTTRVTDFGLLLAILMLVRFFEVEGGGIVQLAVTRLSDLNPAFNYSQLLSAGVSINAIEGWFGLVGILVLFAAIGKSGQFPLTFWLSGAMVAPTPVSAMLHAATMVAAGPYLLYRMSSLFFASDGTVWGGSDAAILAACLVGTVSLILCGLMALCADDAKRVLAYSTASQLGLSIVAVGALSEGAAIWQLTAHAWAKAALFLGVGLLAMQLPSHSTSLTALRGSLRQPLLRLSLLLAALSLAGLPLLPGGQAKDSILMALWTRALLVLDPAAGSTMGQSFPLAQAGWMVCGILVLLSVPLTAAYLIRLIGLLGWSKPAQAEVPAATAETSSLEAQGTQGSTSEGWALSRLLVIVLSLTGTIGLSLIFTLGRLNTRLPLSGASWAWAGEGGQLPLLTAGATLIFLGAGAFFAWRFNVSQPQLGARLIVEGRLHRTVKYFRSGMLLRQFWQAVVGRTGWLLGRVASIFDRRVVDGFFSGLLSQAGNGLAEGSRRFDHKVIEGARWAFCEFWWLVRRLHQRLLQTGYIQHYMFIILLGAVLLCFVVLKPLGDTFKGILGRR